MKINFSDMLHGKIVFSAENGFTELFLSNCRKKGISLYNTVKTDNGLKGYVCQKDLKSAIEASQKSGMEFSVLSRHGLPYIFYRYRRRFGIPVGMLMFILIILVLSSMIWSVEISGAERIPEETVVALLEKAGVSRGVFADSVQCNDVEYFLSNSLEQLSWISVYIAGSRVLVDIKERVEESDMITSDNYTNIVAAKDGEIIRADIFAGEGKIYPGTAVVKGDMLVNGVITFSDGSVKFVDSKAEIWARTKNHINSSAAMTISAEKVIVSKNRYSLYFFGLKIPFGKVENDKIITQSNYFFQSADIVFPIGLIRENYFEKAVSQIEISDIRAALLAFSDFSKASMKLYENAVILEREINLDFSSQISVEGKYLCEENIALEKNFTVNSDGENENSQS